MLHLVLIIGWQRCRSSWSWSIQRTFYPELGAPTTAPPCRAPTTTSTSKWGFPYYKQMNIINSFVLNNNGPFSHQNLTFFFFKPLNKTEHLQHGFSEDKHFVYCCKIEPTVHPFTWWHPAFRASISTRLLQMISEGESSRLTLQLSLHKNLIKAYFRKLLLQ